MKFLKMLILIVIMFSLNSLLYSQSKDKPIEIIITIEDKIINAKLDNNAISKEYIRQLPQTVSMNKIRNREYYGEIDERLNYDEKNVVNIFENGDIAYWFKGNSICFFYNNKEDSLVSSGIIKLGEITSDLSIFYEFGNNIEARIELK